MSTKSGHKHRPDTSLYGIKPRFVRALDPIRTRLEAHGVAPTTVTLAAIPVELAVAASLVVGSSYPPLLAIVPLLTVVWMGLNALDGSLARSSGRTSHTGAVLNELVDRLGDLALIVAAFAIAPLPIAGTLAVGVLATELVAAIGWATTSNRHFAGPMGKPDRAAIVAVGALATIAWPAALTVSFAVIAVGCVAGIVVRTRAVLRHARTLDRAASP